MKRSSVRSRSGALYFLRSFYDGRSVAGDGECFIASRISFGRMNCFYLVKNGKKLAALLNENNK